MKRSALVVVSELVSGCFKLCGKGGPLGCTLRVLKRCLVNTSFSAPFISTIESWSEISGLATVSLLFLSDSIFAFIKFCTFALDFFVLVLSLLSFCFSSKTVSEHSDILLILPTRADIVVTGVILDLLKSCFFSSGKSASCRLFSK